jgi:hypothetical protein
MIAEYQEPKGLSKDTPPINSDYPLVSREAAERGSEMLMEAILLAKGLPIPAKPQRIVVPQLRLVRQAAYTPSACRHCGAPSHPSALMIAHIQHTVASYYGLEPQSMTSAQRGRDMARPRQVAMYLASILTPKSLPDIGRRFGGRDHTTVIYAIKAVKARMDSDAEILLDVEVLKERLAA